MVTLNGVKAIETTEPSLGENFLFVKEAVKNNRLVWLVYKDKQHIIDCNISTNANDLDKFMLKFNSLKSSEHENEIHANDGNRNGRVVKHIDLLNFRSLLRKCRAFKKEIRAMRLEKYHHKHHFIRQQKHKLNMEMLQEGNTKIRLKRGVFSMMYPGTKWCGRGDKAAGGYDDLGENVATDRCCREHDHCPYMIKGFSTNFNYWNYRFHTLSHCNCEER